MHHLPYWTNGISMNWTTGDATKPFWNYWGPDFCVLIVSYGHSYWCHSQHYLCILSLIYDYSIYHVSVNSPTHSYSYTLIIPIFVMILNYFRTLVKNLIRETACFNMYLKCITLNNYIHFTMIFRIFYIKSGVQGLLLRCCWIAI